MNVLYIIDKGMNINLVKSYIQRIYLILYQTQKKLNKDKESLVIYQFSIDNISLILEKQRKK